MTRVQTADKRSKLHPVLELRKDRPLTAIFLPVLLRYSQTLQIFLVAYKKLAVRKG
jgi:hypothetical protein